MKSRSKLGEIDLVRGFAILGVLLVHMTSSAAVKMLESNLYGVYNFLNVFNRFGTTTFIFLSSFVLFYNYYPKALTRERFFKFYRNRLLYIIVPYVLFSGLYYGMTLALQNDGRDLAGMLAVFGKKLLLGEAHYHLYFVFVSIQFYLLFPMVLYLFQRYKRLVPYAFVIGILLQWAFFLWNRYDLQVTNRGIWAISYFSHFFLGAWLGMHYDRVKSWLTAEGERAARRRRFGWISLGGIWLASGLVHTALWYAMRSGGVVYPNVIFDAAWNVFTLTTALVFMKAAFALTRSRATRLTASMRHLGMVSFGVYLLHPFVMKFYAGFPVQSGNSMFHHLWYAGGFVFTLLVSWGLVTAFCRLVPLSWIAFGSVPAQLRAASPPLPASPAPPAASVSG